MQTLYSGVDVSKSGTDASGKTTTKREMGLGKGEVTEGELQRRIQEADRRRSAGESDEGLLPSTRPERHVRKETMPITDGHDEAHTAGRNTQPITRRKRCDQIHEAD